jgi:YD repeat-containing protein
MGMTSGIKPASANHPDYRTFTKRTSVASKVLQRFQFSSLFLNAGLTGSHPLKGLRLLLTASVLAPVVALGQSAPPTQITPSNDTGVKQYQTYSGSHENINLANGNLSLEIPLLSLPGRNGLNLSLGIQYNSKIWSPHASYGSNSDLVYNWRSEQNAWPVGDLGWTFDLPFIYSGSIVTDDQGNPIGRTPSILVLPGGGKASVEYGAASMDSQDGSLVHLDRVGAVPNGTVVNSAVAILKEGTKVYFPCEGCGASQITDTNGNFITFGNGSPNSQIITDTVGRQVTLTQAGTYPSQTITVSYKDSNGAPQNIVLTLSALTLFQTTGNAGTNPYYTGPTPFQHPQPADGVSNAAHVFVSQPPSNFPRMMLTRIDMPGSMTYTFAYNGYGELTQINYPTGGYTKYAYSAFQHGEMFWIGVGRIAEQGGLNIQSDFREVTSKRVCRNAGGTCTSSEEDVTTYTPLIASTQNVNNDSVDIKHFLDEGNNIFEKTTVQFTNDTIFDNISQYYSPRETMRSTYAADGTLLRSVQTAYNSEADLAPFPGLPTSVTTTLYDVNPPLVTKTVTEYDTYSATVRWPPITAESGYQLQTIQSRTRWIDNPLTQTLYDYGQNTPGNPLRIGNTT